MYSVEYYFSAKINVPEFENIKFVKIWKKNPIGLTIIAILQTYNSIEAMIRITTQKSVRVVVGSMPMGEMGTFLAQYFVCMQELFPWIDGTNVLNIPCTCAMYATDCR